MNTIIQLKKIRLALEGLVVFNDLLQDEKAASFCRLLDTVTAAALDSRLIFRHYHEHYKIMAGISWSEYLTALILSSCRTIHGSMGVTSTRGGLQESVRPMPEDAARDLGILQKFAQITADEINHLVVQRFQTELEAEEAAVFTDSLHPQNWPVWKKDNAEVHLEALLPLTAAVWLAENRRMVCDQFLAVPHWEDNVQLLTEYQGKIGPGLFGRYAAFKLEDTMDLIGIRSPDPVRLENLICQEREQSMVLANTESFLKGYPANNMILYGNRGTGKSSLVKALLNTYVSRGLRLIQLKKSQISHFPALGQRLAQIPLKFIIFIDDLSFDEVEEDYKNLKSLMEGGVESRPANVLVYATSNRKNLVRETFDERKADVHSRDTMEEKRSLADRFGITVTFLSPDQETFLKIVQGLAVQNGIRMEPEELRGRALQWVMMHNGRSGRTARQFIDDLIGEQD